MKPIFSFLIFAVLLLSSLEAKEMIQKERSDVMAKLIPIITLLLNENSTPPTKPTIKSTIPTESILKDLTITLHGEAGATIYINGIQKGALDAQGNATITLTLTQGENNITITLKDASGNESEGVSFTTTYSLSQAVAIRFLNKATFGATQAAITHLY